MRAIGKGEISMPETAEQYRHRMYSHVHGRDPLALLAAAPGKLEGLIKRISAAKLRRRPAPGKWSICEIVAHLGDTELVGGYRIRTILGAPGAQIQAFDQDKWAAAMQYQKRNVHKSLDQFRALRHANLSLLKSLTPSNGSNMECMPNAARRASKRSYGCLLATTSITWSRSTGFWR